VDYAVPGYQPTTAQSHYKEQAMDKNTIFVGLDVHKDSIVIALADGDRNQEVRHYGKTGGDIPSFSRAVKKLVSMGAELHFAYEAGPGGFGVYRYLKDQGLDCTVVAPSKIPKKPGDHIKTDARDAESLARLHRAGELTAVWVPTEADEAMRDLTRAREDSKKVQTQARNRLGHFLLRHGVRFEGKTHWKAAHRRWLAGIKMDHPAQQITLQEYQRAVEESDTRTERLTSQILELVPSWKLAPMVKAFQALRGISDIAAATIAAELGDLNRFTSAPGLMSYVGLVPGEYTSSVRVRRLHITKAGNSHARRMLVECSWAYHYPARVGVTMLARQEELPQKIRDIGWKAQVRLCGKFQKLVSTGHIPTKAVVAIARELLGFLWSISREVKIAA
jgi:transposase